MLQEFDLEIKDKKGAENLVADHLSRLLHKGENSVIDDTFPDEQLMGVRHSTPWYADIANYLSIGLLPGNLSR